MGQNTVVTQETGKGPDQELPKIRRLLEQLVILVQELIDLQPPKS